MAEYEPDDSRDVTNTQNRAPGEPPRTGPREDAARAASGQQPEQATPRSGQPGDQALEGDSPNHPDRFGGTAEQGSAQGQGQGQGSDQGSDQSQPQAQESDRWRDKADESEDLPEGK